MFVHNVADLPNLTLASPENLIPGLIWLLLLGVWWAMPGRAAPTYLLVAWGLLNLIGGFATVIPLTRLALQTGAVAPTLLLSHPVCFGPTTIACSGSERVDRVEESQAMNILARWLPGLGGSSAATTQPGCGRI
jgi:hypothetical protein